jgi:ligand-binding sensor domain-containing protein
VSAAWLSPEKRKQMNRKLNLVYLIFMLILNFSCVEKNSSAQEVNSELAKLSKNERLRFKSGIRFIFQDSKGNYWFGSNQDGVCRFDGRSFEYFTTNEGLSDNQVYSIQEDKNGIIWFDTHNGVNSYDGKMIKGYTNVANGFLQSGWIKKENGASGCEWVKTDDDLWFGAGTKEGVYRYDGQRLCFLAFPNPKASPTWNVYSVTGFSKGGSNMLWIGTFAGVFGYDGHRLRVINDESLGLTKEMGKVHVRSVFEDSKGRLWIGNNGIGVLLKDGNTVINFSEQKNLIHAASVRRGDVSPPGTLEHVFAIEEDGQGNIWFGDRDTGAWKYDGKTMTNYSVDQELKSQMIWSIYNDRSNHLLFGMASGGVYRFNGMSFDRVF